MFDASSNGTLPVLGFLFMFCVASIWEIPWEYLLAIFPFYNSFCSDIVFQDVRSIRNKVQTNDSLIWEQINKSTWDDNKVKDSAERAVCVAYFLIITEGID